jgi:hypothetical protein
MHVGISSSLVSYDFFLIICDKKLMPPTLRRSMYVKFMSTFKMYAKRY